MYMHLWTPPPAKHKQTPTLLICLSHDASKQMKTAVRCGKQNKTKPQNKTLRKKGKNSAGIGENPERSFAGTNTGCGGFGLFPALYLATFPPSHTHIGNKKFAVLYKSHQPNTNKTLPKFFFPIPLLSLSLNNNTLSLFAYGNLLFWEVGLLEEHKTGLLRNRTRARRHWLLFPCTFIFYYF